ERPGQEEGRGGRAAGQGPERQWRHLLPQPGRGHEAVEHAPAHLPGHCPHRRGQVRLLRHRVQAQGRRAIRRRAL
ncbi:MAG: FIG00933651: hypothetical protein, partial [uncultured Ramlibacter sp.]